MNFPSYSSSFFKTLFIVILFGMIFTPYSDWLDIQISRLFYEKEAFSSAFYWKWVYLYGILPAWLLFTAALIGWTMSFFTSRRSWRRPCLFLLLTFGVGVGLIIHVALKDHWGRPRPRQTIEFGGEQSFRPYYQPNFNQTESFKSFASGHASTGFYFFALALLGMFYQKRWIYRLGMGSAWGLGVLLSIARIAQGGHFLSDTLASALIMWATSWMLFYLLLLKQDKIEKKIA